MGTDQLYVFCFVFVLSILLSFLACVLAHKDIILPTNSTSSYVKFLKVVTDWPLVIFSGGS